MGNHFAALFPGQGSQYSGMAASIIDEPLVKELFDQADSALGFSLKEMCLNADDQTLTLTANAQPAIFCVSYAAFRLFQNQKSCRPVFAAGHSLGEYTALAASGVIGFTAAIKAVRNRGLFMQDAVPVGVGAMAAVLGAQPDELIAACNEASEKDSVVSPANFNCRGQIVISGHKAKVVEVLSRFKGKLLEVSAPFHCALMAPAAEKMQRYLSAVPFCDADWPVVSNSDNECRKNAGSFPASLIAQISGPVHWEGGIRKIISAGVTHFIEFGPGKVLSGMMKRIDQNAKITNVLNSSDIEQLPDIFA